MSEMFDRKLRALRRDRAARLGGDLFLLKHAFEDCLDRIATFNRTFDRALLVGCPDPSWREQLERFSGAVEVTDPGNLFTAYAQGRQWDEDQKADNFGLFDLILAMGTLDTVNDLQTGLRNLADLTEPGALFIGAISGGETLPLLRKIMAAADRSSGAAAPRVHPRIEAAMLAPLLEQAGFVRPVVDVDRIRVAYSSLDRLIGDLRSMGATNILTERSGRPLNRSELAAANAAFSALASEDGKAVETFEILHFMAWR